MRATVSGSEGTMSRMGLISWNRVRLSRWERSRVLGERGATAEHLVVDAAGEKDVAARVVLADAGGAFEAGVVDRCGVRQIALDVVFVPREAEVEQLGVAVAGEDDVRHLEVAVRDALLERVVEAGHHVGGDLRGVLRFELAADAVEVAEVLAFDELHHDVIQRPFGVRPREWRRCAGA